MRTPLVIGLLATGALACTKDCSPPAPVLGDAGPKPDALSQSNSDAGDPLCAAIVEEEHVDKTRLHCIANARAAWALRVDPADGGRAIAQTIIYLGADKARARQSRAIDGVEWPPALGRHSALFDFDGDGIPEFFSVVPVDVKTFAPAVRNLVTYKNGAISAYPTGGSFLVDAVSDLDNDGHGDLKVSFELGKRRGCDPTDEGTLEVEAAAHGLPNGTFSLTDSAAASFAARRCPAMPAAADMFAPSPSPDARDLSLSWVACSRVRGKSAEAVIGELEAACASYAEATKKCSGPCRHLPDAMAIAKFAPPVLAKD